MRLRSRSGLAAAIAGALVAGGCGDDAAPTRSAEAVEAREENTVRVRGLDYRVPRFRQLNPRIAPDRAFYDGPPPPDGSGVYAAFIRVCNEDGPPAKPTRRIFLEDAFGERFEPVAQPRNEIAFAPRRLSASECLPPANDHAAADGAPLAFVVPFADARERPLVLVIADAGRTARVELDL